MAAEGEEAAEVPAPRLAFLLGALLGGAVLAAGRVWGSGAAVRLALAATAPALLCALLKPRLAAYPLTVALGALVAALYASAHPTALGGALAELAAEALAFLAYAALAWLLARRARR